MTQPITSSPSRNRSGNGGASIIAEGVSITGDLNGESDLQVDGNVEGKIKCDRITIGPAGSVNGQIRAETVLISGTFKGKISATTLTLANSARVDGTLAVKNSLAIEAGAHFEGQCQRPPNKGEPTLNDEKFEQIKKQFGATDSVPVRKVANA